MVDDGETHCYTTKCPSEYTFVGRSDGHECVTSCPDKTYKEEGDNKVCVATCDTKVYQEDKSVVDDDTYFKCAADCASQENYKVIDGGETRCYTTCPDKYTFVGGDNDHQCLETCASKIYKVENDMKICVDTCDKFYEEDSTTISGSTYLKCADSCYPRNYKMEGDKKVCTATCAGGYYQEDSTTVKGYTYFKCAAACANPSTDYRVSEGNEIRCYATNCPTSYKFAGGDDDHECVTTCPSKTYKLEGDKKVCTATCSDHYHQEDSSIVSGQTYFECTTKCAHDNDYRVSENDETYCYYNRCPNGYIFVGGRDNYECMKTCDSKIYKREYG